jgi:hypothetical protein
MSFASHIKRFAEAEILSHRHLPNAPDGTYEPAQEDPGVFLNTVNRIHRSVERGIPLPQNPHAVKAFLQAIDGSLTHSGIDDRLHAFEDGIGILSSLDPESAFVAALNRSAVTGCKCPLLGTERLVADLTAESVQQSAPSIGFLCRLLQVPATRRRLQQSLLARHRQSRPTLREERPSPHSYSRFRPPRPGTRL